MAGSIAKAYVQVIPSAEGIKGKLSGALGGEASAAGNSAGGQFGSSLIGKVKGIIAVAGIGKMLGESLQAGGALQQSLGGVETLFKDSADTVVKNAEKAYKTAGMSANAYMEAVTGFSASLLQGLSGDTEKAASVADMAMTDMSDNANKMGTSMESIQNAYQGFAKQNYTMLDNLKLGYGGTKTEMERLLKDAEKISGVKYDISNLSDVYSAIHVIQGELGITGTTAKEAATTLSGSMASMKAAFSDVLANLSLDRDIGPSLDALEETVFTFITGNLLPMVGNILGTLPQVLSSAFSMAIKGLNMAADNADSILKTGTDIVLGVGNAIITSAPYLLEAAVNLVAALGNAIVTTDWMQIGQDTINGLRGSLDLAAGEILGTDGNIVQSVLNAIATGLPDLLAKGGEIINSVVSGIFSMLPSVTESALQMLVSFTTQLISGLPEVISTGKDILLNLVEGIRSALPDMLASAGETVGNLLTGIVQNLPSIIAAGFDLVISLVQGIGNAAPDILAGAGRMIKNVWNAVKEIDWIQLGVDVINGLIKGMTSLYKSIWDAGKNLATKAFDAMKNIDWRQLGKDMINGLINGIGAMGNALWNAAKSIARTALNSIKSFLGIASPSKVMRDQVGKWIPSGVAVGIKANTKPLTDAMHGISGLTADTMAADLSLQNAIPSLYTTSTVKTARSSFKDGNDVLLRISEFLGDVEENQRKLSNMNLEILNKILDAICELDLVDDRLMDKVNNALKRKARMDGNAWVLY